MKKFWIGFLCLGILLSGCGSSSDEDTKEDDTADTTKKEEKKEEEKKELTELKQFPESFADDTQVAVFHTSKGDITVALFPEEAPKAVENFVTHAQEGYYDGVIFHRVIADFMIQGGDPEGTGMGGESIWGEGFEIEASDELYNFNGALAMANTGQANSNGSQFFIVQASTLSSSLDNSLPQLVKEKYQEVGGANWLDGDYSVFGQVISGMDIVNAIAAVETDENDKPVEDIIIQSITITTYGEIK
ncbi:peptidylprolyl isomerase [Breznakia pachnodae]|uniref:Peptidyl-prolyl cis-trans isomerase n=1 Tax=Breznakia pachnodae TaxID=265178 RepID=A0ABU0E2Z9_9FIRM|nr:peptidylprolyl isomerase [Breznakia pachnodae]MDQ0361101.1 peptidyl-prolyl cis-trans isomerase B (cyclophilin B) [Breznakia pachnodae]